MPATSHARHLDDLPRLAELLDGNLGLPERPDLGPVFRSADRGVPLVTLGVWVV